MNHTGHHSRFGLALLRALLIALVFALMQGSSTITQAQSGGALAYGSSVYGAISATQPLVTYSFTGAEGDYVVVTADSWTGTLDIQVDLVAPNGLVLVRSGQNTPSGEPLGAYISRFLPDSGVYLLRISGADGSAGDFMLSVQGRSAATAMPLDYGQSVDVTIAQNAEPQYFSFQVEDCPTTLIVSDPSEGETFAFPFVVKVRDQRGYAVALLRGGEQLEDWVTVEARSGRYEVEVLAADPTLSGSIRLLVTCADDNPGCVPGASTGAADCPPCPSLDQLVPGGACPDMNFRAIQEPDGPNWVTVTWDAMPGATGYAVYVTGLIEGGGETYLTHAEWVPGDPLHFTWILPTTGYVGYNFTLQVLVDDVLLCTETAHVDLRTTGPDCPPLGLTYVMTDPIVRALTLNWSGGLGADQFALDMYSIEGESETYSGRLLLPGDASNRAFDHFPPQLDGVRFVLWMTVDGMLCSEELTVMFDGTLHACPELGLTVSAVDVTAGTITLSWFGLEDIEGYQLDIYGTPEGGAETLLLMTEVMPPSTTSMNYTVPEGYVGFRFVLRLVGGPIECTDELVSVRQQQGGPCAVRADREGVAVRVGPGPMRSIFIYMPPGIQYEVVGQAVDEEGNAWWQLDKTRFAGHESVISLWVRQSDVTPLGDCSQVPQTDIPEVVPEPEEPSGGWGACGSCDTCGHPGRMRHVTGRAVPVGSDDVPEPAARRPTGRWQRVLFDLCFHRYGAVLRGGIGHDRHAAELSGWAVYPWDADPGACGRRRSEMRGEVVDRLRRIRQRSECLIPGQRKLHRRGAYGVLTEGPC
ncbi:MAG: hypothetical protein IPK19_01685 [Chloroflexi bacterium]|nr:hypothetical protein [Chloroflexota bacterium]